VTRATRSMPQPSAASGGWVLYHLIGFDDALIYVGKSNDGLRRLVEHLKDQPWRQEIRDHLQVATFATEAEVLAAEEHAIRTLRPRFNIQCNEGNPDRVDPHTMRHVDGTPYRPDLYPQPFDAAGYVERPRPRTARGVEAVQRRRRAPRLSPRWRRRRNASVGYLTAWLALGAVLWWTSGHLTTVPPQGRLYGAVGLPVGLLVWWARSPRRRRTTVVALGAIAAVVGALWLLAPPLAAGSTMVKP